MRFDRVVARVRNRRGMAAMAAVLALVLAGGVVALVDDENGPTRSAVAADEHGVGGRLAPAQPFALEEDNALMGAASAAGAGTAGDTAAAKAAPAVGAVPKVIKTATLRVEVRKGGFRAAFDRAASIADAHGGHVASSNESTVEDKASEGTLTIRVPADRFDAARKALAGLGTVEHQELGGHDVTAQIVDYDARIRNLQAQEQALSTLLSRARTVGEVLEVQGQLFNVRQQIEQLQAERNNLDAQAAMATITATVFEPGAAPAKEPKPTEGLARSWERAWDGAVAVVGGMVVVVGYALPLILLAVLAWAIWRAVRRTGAVPAA